MREVDVIRLRHMLDAAREAVGFVCGRARSDLDEDRQLTLALVKDIEIIGEAAYQVSQATRDETPAIPWDDIIGMRHRLVHAYFDIDLDILWKTAQEDLPHLIAALEQVIQGISG
jgi:uncharacterized protein with HEPN domain